MESSVKASSITRPVGRLDIGIHKPDRWYTIAVVDPISEVQAKSGVTKRSVGFSRNPVLRTFLSYYVHAR